jgi:hypothetical protein
LPIVILLAVLSATFGLAFVLENLRPRGASMVIAKEKQQAQQQQQQQPQQVRRHARSRTGV